MVSARLHVVIPLSEKARGNAASDDKRETKQSDPSYRGYGSITPSPERGSGMAYHGRERPRSFSSHRSFVGCFEGVGPLIIVLRGTERNLLR
jgi:hypothetical protein